MKKLFRAEPVRVLLNGIAGVVSLVLIALAALGGLDWDSRQIAAVVAAIAGGANLISETIRAAVYSPATVDQIREG